MSNTIQIQFIRKNKNDVGTYTASSAMNLKIQMLYKWLYDKKRPINVLLTNISQIFFSDIDSFCKYKTFPQINTKRPLEIYAYVDKENNILFLQIEQGTYDNCINFDNTIFSKIMCEHNLHQELSVEELNNFHNIQLCH